MNWLKVFPYFVGMVVIVAICGAISGSITMHLYFNIRSRIRLIIAKRRMLKEFKEKLQEAMDTRSIMRFKRLLGVPPRDDCPGTSVRGCVNCSLSDKNGPGEFIGTGAYGNTCLVGSMREICLDYSNKRINKETAVPRLVLIGIKLLLYLETKERE